MPNPVPVRRLARRGRGARAPTPASPARPPTWCSTSSYPGLARRRPRAEHGGWQVRPRSRRRRADQGHHPLRRGQGDVHRRQPAGRHAGVHGRSDQGRGRHDQADGHAVRRRAHAPSRPPSRRSSSRSPRSTSYTEFQQRAPGDAPGGCALLGSTLVLGEHQTAGGRVVVEPQHFTSWTTVPRSGSDVKRTASITAFIIARPRPDSASVPDMARRSSDVEAGAEVDDPDHAVVRTDRDFDVVDVAGAGVGEHVGAGFGERQLDVLCIGRDGRRLHATRTRVRWRTTGTLRRSRGSRRQRNTMLIAVRVWSARPLWVMIRSPSAACPPVMLYAVEVDVDTRRGRSTPGRRSSGSRAAAIRYVHTMSSCTTPSTSTDQ